MPIQVDQTPSDDESVAVVQKLFIKHSNSIRGFLFAISADGSLVDDVMHSAFLAITLKADQFDAAREFVPWARGVAKNELLKITSSARRGPMLLPHDAIEQLQLTAPEFPQSDERIPYVAQCVEELSPRAKRAITLRYRKAIMPKEIARMMSLTVDSVSVMLSRARKALRECVERKMKQESQ